MKTERTTLDSLLEDLAQEPDNWGLRGVLADFAQDTQQPMLAECLLWMIEKKKRPYIPKDAPTRALWFNEDTIAADLGDKPSDIPGVLYERLQEGQEISHHRAYLSAVQAERDFFEAWRLARQSGQWDGKGKEE